MADPAGATHYITATANHALVPAAMPDATNTFAVELCIDQATGTNYEGGAAAFIDGLAANCTDLRVYNSDASIEIPFGVEAFSKTPGSRKLILSLGIPSTAQLLASVDTVYRLYRGCTGGTFESKTGVAPVADGYQGYWPACEGSGIIIEDWTTAGRDLTLYNGGATPWVADTLGRNAIDLSAVGDYLLTAGTGWADAYTFTARILINTLASSEKEIMDLGVKDECPGISYGADGKFLHWDGSYFLHSTVPLTGTWYSVAISRSEKYTGTKYLYVDGAEETSSAGNQDVKTTWRLGILNDTPNRDLDARLNCMQVSSVRRSANWITTLHNALGSNATFWTVGAQISLFASGIRRFNPYLSPGTNPGWM